MRAMGHLIKFLEGEFDIYFYTYINIIYNIPIYHNNFFLYHNINFKSLK